MKYTELSDEEMDENVIEEIADTMISIAHANSEFVCTECEYVLGKLGNVLRVLDSSTYDEVHAEVCEILGREV